VAAQHAVGPSRPRSCGGGAERSAGLAPVTDGRPLVTDTNSKNGDPTPPKGAPPVAAGGKLAIVRGVRAEQMMRSLPVIGRHVNATVLRPANERRAPKLTAGLEGRVRRMRGAEGRSGKGRKLLERVHGEME